MFLIEQDESIKNRIIRNIIAEKKLIELVGWLVGWSISREGQNQIKKLITNKYGGKREGRGGR
jgi:hypothetical protein